MLGAPGGGTVPVQEASFLFFFSVPAGMFLEMLKGIFESDDCSILIQRPGVEEANLPDALEHWALCEYVELAIFVCRDRVKQTPEFALRVVVDGGTRIDGGL